MKKLLIAFLLFAYITHAQVQKEDGTWWDNNLMFKVLFENLKSEGEIWICVYDTSRQACIQNVMAPFEVRVFDQQNEEIWNSLWTGKNMELKFSKALPTAHRVEINATRPFVINKMTGTRIYQDKAMHLNFILP